MNSPGKEPASPIDYHARAFQASLLGLFTLGFVAIQFLSFFVAGAPPERQFGVRPLSDTRRVVTWVTADAARDGLRVNDEYDWARGSTTQCDSRYMAQRVGDRFTLPVIRDERLHNVSLLVRPMSSEDKWTLIWSTAFKTIGMLVGILLIARGAGRFGYFAGLAFFGTAAVVGEPSNAALSFTSQVVLYGAVGGIATIFFYLHLEAVLELCKARKVERWALRIPALLALSFVLFNREQYVQHGLFSPCVSTAHGRLYYYALIVLWLWPLSGYAIAALDRSARDRIRDAAAARWMFITYLIASSGPALNLYFAAIQQPHAFGRYLNLTYPIMAIGYVYIGLQYRLIAGKWVIDRALVYATTISIVVAVIAVGEFFLIRILSSLGRSSENLLLGTILAIILGIVLWAFHGPINHGVERVVFWRKHALEKELHRLTRESKRYSNGRQLAQFMCDGIRNFLDVSPVAFYELSDGALQLRGVSYAAADALHQVPQVLNEENEEFTRIRAGEPSVDFRSEAPMLPGIKWTLLAVMKRRGRTLVAALLCGHSEEYDTFSDDESDFLIKAARSTALCMQHLKQ